MGGGEDFLKDEDAMQEGAEIRTGTGVDGNQGTSKPPSSHAQKHSCRWMRLSECEWGHPCAHSHQHANQLAHEQYHHTPAHSRHVTTAWCTGAHL